MIILCNAATECMQIAQWNYFLGPCRTSRNTPNFPPVVVWWFSISVVVFVLKGKTFEITYVRLKFHSSRPESFAIYRHTNESADWTPYQFYSSTCRGTYGMTPERTVSSDNEARAICRDDFSDISPLSGASVAFSTLEGRPSAYNFDNSAQLQVTVIPTLQLLTCYLVLFKGSETLRIAPLHEATSSQYGTRCQEITPFCLPPTRFCTNDINIMPFTITWHQFILCVTFPEVTKVSLKRQQSLSLRIEVPHGLRDTLIVLTFFSCFILAEVFACLQLCIHRFGQCTWCPHHVTCCSMA